MPITAEIPLPDLLTVVGLLLIHPVLTGIRQSPTSARPVQILTLAGSLSTGAVLEASVSGSKIVRPLLRCGGEVRIPAQVGTVD